MSLANRQALQKRIKAKKKLIAQRPGKNVYQQMRLEGLQGKRSRLGIPKVNQDPRPPNEDRGQNRKKGQDNQSKKGGKGQGGKGGQNGQGGQGGQGGGAGSPTQPQAPGPTFAPPTDPRDDTYWRDVVALQSERNNQLRSLDIEETYGRSEYEQAMQQMALQHPRDQLAIKEGANQAGALYSSRTGESLGQLEQQRYFDQTNMERDYQKEGSLRSMMRDMISSGYSADEAAARAAATDRAATGEIDRPAPTVDPVSALFEQAKKRRGKPKKGKGKGKGKSQPKKKNQPKKRNKRRNR